MTTPPRAAASSRNGFLDVVRTVAILRVLAWHAYGTPWISYFIASMPAMFFVAGTLMCQSLERSGPLKVLRDRFRRLLIPLWVFSLVAISVMALYDWRRPDPAGNLDYARLVFWFFPVWDPEGSRWGVTWWAALWYLRCTTWLILLSPVFGWLMRRLWLPVLSMPLVALAAMEIASRQGVDVRWQFHDLALFSFFWLLGFAYSGGRLSQVPRWCFAFATAVFAALAALWVLTQDVPNNIVNASYPLHLLVGLAWLSGALALERQVGALATARGVRPVIGWVNQRALSIYLWHAAGLFVAYHLLWGDSFSRAERLTLTLPVVAIVTFALVLTFGWVEDYASKRSLRVWPATLGPLGHWRLRRLATVSALASACAGGFVLVGVAAMQVRDEAPGALSVAQAAPPSGVGLKLRTAQARIVAEPPERKAPVATGPVSPGELQAAVDSWLAKNQMSGVSVALLRGDGSGWSGAAGTNSISGAPATPNDVYPIASVTKTFTAALIMQLVDEGLVSLNDPVVRYVPDFPSARRFTIRQLLQHTSGLVSTDGVPPFDALQFAAVKGLQFRPGTAFEYSSPGYFMLGLVIEQVTGMSYTDALHARLLDPLDLRATRMDEEIDPQPYSTHPFRGVPSTDRYGGVIWTSGGLHDSTPASSDYHGVLWSAGGLHSSVVNVAYWGVLLWDSGLVVSPASLDAMTTFLGPPFQYTGLGTYPFCPCWNSGGRLRGQRWGHLGSSGVLEYDPLDRVAIAIHTNETESVIDEKVIVAYDELSQALRDLIRGRQLPVAPGG